MRSTDTIRIGIDARTVFCPERRGTGKNLVDLYQRMASARPDWEFIVYYERQGFENPYSGIRNIIPRRLTMSGSRWDLWQNLRLPLAAKLDGVDLLHCPAQYAPWLKLTRTVVTVHDIIPLRFPGNYGDVRSIAQRLRRSLSVADAVMSVSQYSKRDIVDYFNADPEKISVITWAPEDESRVAMAADIAAVRKKYATGETYLFTFGATDPRKNTERVIRAFARWKNGGGDGRLVISGIRQSHEGPFREEARACGIESDVVFCGFVPDEEIPALLGGAACLLFASLYEGFGLPLLDAMACGVPIIASQTTSLPEVAEKAALYCDPESEESIAEAIGRFMMSEDLRTELRVAGLERVKEFTWDRTAGQVLEVFERVLSQ